MYEFHRNDFQSLFLKITFNLFENIDCTNNNSDAVVAFVLLKNESVIDMVLFSLGNAPPTSRHCIRRDWETKNEKHISKIFPLN